MQQFKTIWISDVHLGSPNSDADLLVDFLRETKSDRLYLVGDILDIIACERRPYWDKSHGRAVKEILRKTADTEVIYIPGNHDELVRRYVGQRIEGVEIHQEAVHFMKGGRQLLITHGDFVDDEDPHQQSRTQRLGRWLYGFTGWLNRAVNTITKVLDKPYWGVNTFLKNSVPVVSRHVDNFEAAVRDHARQRGFDGVVCGHIHVPRLEYDVHSIYANCGDWIENCTALVEHVDGRLEIVNWRVHNG